MGTNCHPPFQYIIRYVLQCKYMNKAEEVFNKKRLEVAKKCQLIIDKIEAGESPQKAIFLVSISN